MSLRHRILVRFIASLALLSLVCTARAQQLPEAPEPQAATTHTAPPQNAARGRDNGDVTIRSLAPNLIRDQENIWTSPLHFTLRDAEYLVPLGVATGLLIGSDQHTMTQLIHTNSADQRRSRTISDAGVAGIAALPALMYGWSVFRYAPRARETALLSGEAAANAYIVNEGLKIALRRERPLVDGARGHFNTSAWNDGGFPSNHAVLAWSMAAVLASEYPGWLSRLSVYTAATAVSVSRVTAKEHFPSDVLVGSAAGWLIGRYVYRAHHNSDLDLYSAGEDTSFAPPPDPILRRPPSDIEIDPDRLGSSFVPMDSWIYPALERLTALGIISNTSFGIRPWTRLECWRQLQEAEEALSFTDRYSPAVQDEAERTLRDLRTELAHDTENRETVAVDSLYARYGTIAGPALSDSYHFGQTWWNDYGRPLEQGPSFLGGFSVRATRERMFFYVREEFQGAASPHPLSENTRSYLATLDQSPVAGGPFPILPPANNSPIRRQRPIELYAGIAFAGNALSFGKQEIYWSPLISGPLSFSTNAEPTYNLRFVSTRPHPIPLLAEFGTYRFDLFAGKLSGHSFPARPWFNGQKITLNFGRNLELGFARWSVFAGVGHPLTLGRWRRNIFSLNSTGSLGYGSRNDPGDRKSSFDFRLRVPGLRNLVTLYGDSYADDEPNPLSDPFRSILSPGIYISRLPWLPHTDLRIESTSSLDVAEDKGGRFFYWNNQYLDANTNKGFLLGNATGRDARSIEGRLTQWFSARTSVQAGYRQTKGGTKFLAGGSTISDGFARSSFALGDDWTLDAFAQYERFLIPSLRGLPANAGPQHNVSGWLQITYRPKWTLSRSSN